MDLVLEAFEAADKENSIRGKRWTIEHATYVQPDQMDRIKQLGLVISAQAQPYRGATNALRTLGKERAERAVPIKEFMDRGIIVTGGSDWGGNSDSNNPFANIYFYVTRRSMQGEVAGAAQKISRTEALRVETINNAYLTFEEKIKGSIEAGKLADFVILSQDIMTVPEEQIRNITPLATYVGGKKAYSSNGGS
jgi:predicted amidohydrolase YtcJ